MAICDSSHRKLIWSQTAKVLLEGCSWISSCLLARIPSLPPGPPPEPYTWAALSRLLFSPPSSAIYSRLVNPNVHLQPRLQSSTWSNRTRSLPAPQTAAPTPHSSSPCFSSHTRPTDATTIQASHRGCPVIHIQVPGEGRGRYWGEVCSLTEP